MSENQNWEYSDDVPSKRADTTLFPPRDKDDIGLITLRMSKFDFAMLNQLVENAESKMILTPRGTEGRSDTACGLTGWSRRYDLRLQ